MKKHLNLLLAVACALLLSFGIVGCVSSGSTATVVTPSQQTIANAVEDLLAIGLVPVLTKNPSYLADARVMAATLDAFSGTEISAADVSTALAKTSLSEADAKTVAALINAAWATFQKRYAEQLGSTVRPDVKLFLSAASAGITRAIASVPTSTAYLPPSTRYFGALGLPAIS